MRYRVHRIKDQPGEHFRWAAHTGGLATVKPKDYEPASEGETIEAVSPYAAWKQLAGQNMPLRPGDLLEALDPVSGPALQIAKYIGFESAQWFVPEPKPESSAAVHADIAHPASNDQVIPAHLA
jgi:hypothetical protein